MKITISSLLFIVIVTASYGQAIEPEGRMVDFQTPDGTDGEMYYVEANPNSDEYVFLFSGDRDLNKKNKILADKFAEDLGDIHVVVIDLQNENKNQSKNIREARTNDIIRGALNFAGNSAEVGLVGIGEGTENAYQAALLSRANLRGLVLFNKMPSIDPDELVRLNSDVLLVMEGDQIDAERLNSFKSVMNDSEVEFILEQFNSDTENPENDFEPSEREKAYNRAYGFLQNRLN